MFQVIYHNKLGVARGLTLCFGEGILYVYSFFAYGWRKRVYSFDIVVIGAGHAGCEAALSAARMGLRVAVFAINLDSVAMMPCNPSIGGTSKGHLVREVDALGGEMGRNIDKTYIQSRMLNKGKGPAVYSLRAQADKQRYSTQMKMIMEAHPRISLVQAEVVEVLVEGYRVAGVKVASGRVVKAMAVIICSGTYLDSRCLTGELITDSGPNGLKNSKPLAAQLRRLGLRLRRFKTGTPARIDAGSIDFSKMEEQPGDDVIVPFSFLSSREGIERPQIPCYLTYTTEETHDVIRRSLHRSPMYSGIIEGTGTRYCPSIEDKVMRFPDKDRHQVFIEPEGEGSREMYVGGMSTSLPEDVQDDMYRTVPGLENAQIMRYGYAIEYECIDPTQLSLSLEFKDISGLFTAGQMNGSSGYEEAAAQGIMAGVNAALKVLERDPFVLARSEAYIGVLIDDLVTKGTNEPYRMMTSRAEYRLLLRQDNADLRLVGRGADVGLVSSQRLAEVEAKREAIGVEVGRLERTPAVISEELSVYLAERGSAKAIGGVRLGELVRRPELDYASLAPFDKGRPQGLSEDVVEQVNIQMKYDGYIKKQTAQAEQLRRMESRELPSTADYASIKGLRLEARQKLSAIRPANLGQAARISGVSPADISVLMILTKSGAL